MFTQFEEVRSAAVPKKPSQSLVGVGAAGDDGSVLSTPFLMSLKSLMVGYVLSWVVNAIGSFSGTASS
jgi:hypothetical protein